MNLYESRNLPQCISTVSLPISIVSLTVSSLHKLYQLYKLYEPNERLLSLRVSNTPAVSPSSLVRSYLSSRHKPYKLNELYERNELYPQPLARRYPSTDGRQPAASNLSSVFHCVSNRLYRVSSCLQSL